MSKLMYKELSDLVLGGVFKVHNKLGPGLLESAYEGACEIEFRRRGLTVERQVVYPLYYEGELAGAYVADMVIAGKIILELKSVKVLSASMEAQLINYLRLSEIPVGYLVNFCNERVEWKRRVLSR